MKQTEVKDRVFKAANLLAAEGVMPTVGNVALEALLLESQVGKHLKAWKQQLLKQYAATALQNIALHKQLDQQSAMLNKFKQALSAMLAARDIETGAEEVMRILQGDNVD